jgi:hypothetical protein
MSSSKIVFSSRLSSRAVVGGTLSALSIMLLLMMLAGGLRLWQFNLYELTTLGAGFWVWASASWVLSLYISGYLSSMASRSITARDGILHGVVTWASASVFGCIFLAIVTNKIINGEMSQLIFWGAFIGNILAVGASIMGGVQGAHDESEAEVVEDQIRTSEEGRLQHAYGR